MDGNGKTPAQQLGAFLRRRREELGLTQQEVADRVSITREAYQRIESGHIKRTHVDNLRAIARALDVDFALLERLRLGDPSWEWPDIQAKFRHIASFPDHDERIAQLATLPPALVADLETIAEAIQIEALRHYRDRTR